MLIFNIGVLFVAVCAISNGIVAKYLPQHPYKIVDLMHNAFPLFKHPHLTDIATYVPIGCIALSNSEFLPEYCLIAGCSYLLRLLCISPTVLPPLDINAYKVRYGNGLMGIGTEYIYSGHAIHLILFIFYFPLIFGISSFISAVYASIIAILIIISHNHYSVDIIIAGICTAGCYTILKLLQTHPEFEDDVEEILYFLT